MTNAEPMVYILEDKQGVSDSIANILRKFNIKTEIFYNASSYLKDHDPTRSGCLIVDINLKDINSFELSNRLNEIGNFMPIIFIGDPGEIATMIRSQQPAALCLITTPFREETLLVEVRKAMMLSKITQNMMAHATSQWSLSHNKNSSI